MNIGEKNVLVEIILSTFNPYLAAGSPLIYIPEDKMRVETPIESSPNGGFSRHLSGRILQGGHQRIFQLRSPLLVVSGRSRLQLWSPEVQQCKLWMIFCTIHF